VRSGRTFAIRSSRTHFCHPLVSIVTGQDRAIPPGRQRLMAARAGQVFEIDGDHSPFLGRLTEVAAIGRSQIKQIDDGRT